MDKFVWTSEYSVGIKEIDEQHQHFFEIANRIIDLTMKTDLAQEDVAKSLEELGNYAFYHLGTEEGYFDKFNYPDAPLHIAAHNDYRKMVNDYFVQLRAAGSDFKKIAEEMASYSINWLSGHILLVDKKYTQFFNEHGLS